MDSSGDSNLIQAPRELVPSHTFHDMQLDEEEYDAKKVRWLISNLRPLETPLSISQLLVRKSTILTKSLEEKDELLSYSANIPSHSVLSLADIWLFLVNKTSNNHQNAPEWN